MDDGSVASTDQPDQPRGGLVPTRPRGLVLVDRRIPLLTGGPQRVTRKDARRCRVGPLLVDLFLHIRVHLFCLQVSEHLGVEEIEIYQNSEARSVLKPSETYLYIVDMTKKVNRDIYT